jgi:hypothetical protein
MACRDETPVESLWIERKVVRVNSAAVRPLVTAERAVAGRHACRARGESTGHRPPLPVRDEERGSLFRKKAPLQGSFDAPTLLGASDGVRLRRTG